MAENRYVKLNANWMDSEWLIVLSAEARLAWVQLLCYVKAYGIGGRVKSKSPAVFAKQNFLGEESVEQMLRAAKADSALEIEEGEWVLTGWSQHQGDATNADRQKRYRENHKQPEKPPDRNGSNALRNASNTEERRGEEKIGDTPLPSVVPPRGPTKGNRPADLAEVQAYGKGIGLPPEECTDCWEFYENNGWKQSGRTPMKDWRLAVNRWKRKWLKDRPKGAVAPQPGPDPDRTTPKDGLDYVLRAKGDGVAPMDAKDPTRAFDAPDWFRSRKLNIPSKWAEYCERFEEDAA